MGKLFFSRSSLGLLFIPLLTVSKVGIVELIDDGDEDYNNNDVNALTLIKQLGELKELGLINEDEFESKRKKLLSHI